jgi:hypothetical protein
MDGCGQFADGRAVVNAGNQSGGLVALIANVLVLFVFRVWGRVLLLKRHPKLS